MAISARSNNRESFYLPMPICWEIFVEKIGLTQAKYGFETHAFILMPNHIHWLLSTPNLNLGDGMGYFMTETSRAIARSANRINKIYGGRYKPVVIGHPYYYSNTFRYFFQNPIRAGIVQTVQQYPWSSFGRPKDFKISPCPGFEEFIPNEPEELEVWLNTPPPSILDACIKKALRRAEFRFPRHPTKKVAICPETSFDAPSGKKTTDTYWLKSK